MIPIKDKYKYLNLQTGVNSNFMHIDLLQIYYIYIYICK